MQKRVMWILMTVVLACAPVAWAAPMGQPPPKPQPMGGQPPTRVPIIIPMPPFGVITVILVTYANGVTEIEIPCPPGPPAPIDLGNIA